MQEKGLTPAALRMQAQTAAAAAETSALEAGKHARMSHCIQALTAAQAAAQSFNLVCFPYDHATDLAWAQHQWRCSTCCPCFKLVRQCLDAPAVLHAQGSQDWTA